MITLKPQICRLWVTGQMHKVNYVAHPECFLLRALFYNVNNSTSFENILTVKSICYVTYKQAFLANGSIFNDKR